MGAKVTSKGVLVGLVAIAACVALAVPAWATWTDAHTKSVAVAPGQVGTATASCPAGEHAAAGGIGAPFNGPAIYPQAMGFNATQTGWTVKGASVANVGGNLTAAVYCNKHSAYTVATKKVTITAGHLTTATATCPSGKVVLAAGYSLSPPLAEHAAPNAIITRLRRPTANTVQARAAVLTFTTALTAIAYCGAGPAPVEKATALAIGSAGGVKTVTSVCPSGKHFIFGGFDGVFNYPTSGPEVLPLSLSSTSIGKWSVSGYNLNPTAANLTAYAYCR